MFKFKKKFGQNFLVNNSIIDKIVSCFSSDTHIFEIGPGDGALTKKFLQNNKKITAVEIDPDCIEILKNLENLTLLHADILNYDIPNLPVVGNIPYHLSSSIVEKLVLKPVEKIVLMVQKEFADILTGKEISKITYFAQSRYKIESICKVPRSCFYPKPKVDSEIIKLTKIENFHDINLEKLKNILFLFFSSRRKKISHIKRGNLKFYEKLHNLDFNFERRAEDLCKEEYFWLSNLL